MSIANVLKKLNSRDTKLFPKFSKKSKVIIFFVIVSLAVIFTQVSLAQNLIKDKQDAISKGNNQESWMNEALGSNLVSMQIMIGGTIPDTILMGETTPNGYPVTSYKPGGFLGSTSQLVSYTFTPPASGVEYIAQIKNSFLGKPVYAQNTGFNSLNKILPLWKTFRNTVYSLSALFFIIVGIMIMLRVKISSQAVVTLQSSIPKIVTSLILVTFSYAIAGIFIDLMNFFLAFGLALLFNGLGKDFSNNLFPLSLGDISPTNIVNGIKGLFGENAFNYRNLSSGDLWTLLSMFSRMIPSVILASLAGIIGAAIGFVFAGPTGSLIIGVGSVLLIVVLEIVIAFNIIKFLFALVKCYISIILKIIFAPFEIAMGAFPNSKIGFSSWATDLVANLAVFPISLLFLVIINILIDYLGGGLWTPVMLSGAVTFFLPTMVGIGAIFMLPKLPSMIPEFVFSIKPSPWGKAIGQGFNESVIGKGIGVVKKGTDERMVSNVSGAVDKISTKTQGRVKSFTKTWKPNEVLQEARKNTLNSREDSRDSSQL